MVFNVLSKNFPSIVFGCPAASDGSSRQISALYDMANAPGSVVRRYSYQIGMSCKKRFALSEGSGMRLYRPDCLKSRIFPADQVMRNWSNDFGNNSQLTIEQQIVGTMD